MVLQFLELAAGDVAVQTDTQQTGAQKTLHRPQKLAFW